MFAWAKKNGPRKIGSSEQRADKQQTEKNDARALHRGASISIGGCIKKARERGSSSRTGRREIKERGGEEKGERRERAECNTLFDIAARSGGLVIPGLIQGPKLWPCTSL